MKTYEKPTSLFLYISLTSAHSPGVLKSIIFGNVCCYWYQNSNIDDYRCIIRQFASRLEARGHAKADLSPIFKERATRNDYVVLAYARSSFFVKQKFSPTRNHCNLSVYIYYIFFSTAISVD
jgi:hypothetical protein